MMRISREFLGAGVLFLSALAVVVVPNLAAARAQNAALEDVPAYHTQLPPGPLPATMNPAQFENPLVKNAYALAAHDKKLLYQQPCYCHCDRSQGHASLLDCFTGQHAAVCSTCLLEGLYVSEQSRRGKSAAQIRKDIEAGEWQKVDATKYQRYPMPRSVSSQHRMR
jgi:hypothetical protein